MINVVNQVRLALRPRNRLPTLIGFLLGGFVPLACYWLAHHEAPALTAEGSRALALIGGGLAYSATTVYQWAKAAFLSGLKSAGFCVLVEGVMISSHTAWLSCAALCYLIVINGVATGVNLSLGPKGKR